MHMLFKSYAVNLGDISVIGPSPKYQFPISVIYRSTIISVVNAEISADILQNRIGCLGDISAGPILYKKILDFRKKKRS
ncbi:hypothetical protein HanRHA438_Chr09g0419881 [Helianthus annuus]|nr:hypothetical protein HanRHA438_Chr09g0419881 [Helianthus annuus]